MATEVNLGDWVITRSKYNICHIACISDGKALVDQYFDLKGPKGATGDTGASGAKGDTGASGQKGDTGDTGPVNLASSLDTTDTTNAIKNAPVAIAIENIQTAIGTITSTQTSNLNLLGS